MMRLSLQINVIAHVCSLLFLLACVYQLNGAHTHRVSSLQSRWDTLLNPKTFAIAESAGLFAFAPNNQSWSNSVVLFSQSNNLSLPLMTSIHRFDNSKIVVERAVQCWIAQKYIVYWKATFQNYNPSTLFTAFALCRLSSWFNALFQIAELHDNPLENVRENSKHEWKVSPFSISFIVYQL